MKPFAVVFCALVLVSCSKKEDASAKFPNEGAYVEIRYDTTAVDSFSTGASNVNIEQNIKMASKTYRDSVTKVLLQEKERKELVKQAEELAKKEAEKKKLDDKKAAESQSSTTSNP